LWISTDTLAAALAERGFFTEAIQTQEQAIAHLKKVDPDMRELDRHVELDQHLKSLRRHQPWRDEAITIFNVKLFNTNSRLDPLGPYTDSFVQDAIRFIAFETDLDKKSEGKGLLGIRYIRPNGTWFRNNSSPIGLTTEIEIAPGRRSLKWGWGNAERSIFTSGKYRLEFYWGVEKLATKSFDVR
jgi:hypothetical protein